MSYTKTNWENGATPAINAGNLNHMEQGIYDAHDMLDGAIKYTDYPINISASGATTMEFTETISIPSGYSPLSVAVIDVNYSSDLFHVWAQYRIDKSGGSTYPKVVYQYQTQGAVNTTAKLRCYFVKNSLL